MQGYSEQGLPSSIHRRMPTSQPCTPARKSSIAVLSARLFSQRYRDTEIKDGLRRETRAEAHHGSRCGCRGSRERSGGGKHSRHRAVCKINRVAAFDHELQLARCGDPGAFISLPLRTAGPFSAPGGNLPGTERAALLGRGYVGHPKALPRRGGGDPGVDGSHDSNQGV